MKNFFHKQDGFTIQEILVVLIVGSILVSLSLALFQFTNELFQMWHGTTELKSDVNRIIHTIAIDIQRSDCIVERTETGLILSKGSGWHVKYTYENQKLMRNDIDLTPQKVKNFLVRWEDVPDRKGFSPLVRIKIMAQSKWSSYESEIVCGVMPSSKSEFISSK
jgi:prepilin-type N-terminal cleavage/methylation domain-containing protein